MIHVEIIVPYFQGPSGLLYEKIAVVVRPLNSARANICYRRTWYKSYTNQRGVAEDCFHRRRSGVFWCGWVGDKGKGIGCRRVIDEDGRVFQRVDGDGFARFWVSCFNGLDVPALNLFRPVELPPKFEVEGKPPRSDLPDHEELGFHGAIYERPLAVVPYLLGEFASVEVSPLVFNLSEARTESCIAMKRYLAHGAICATCRRPPVSSAMSRRVYVRLPECQ
eukprot:scaffold15529_cov49-Attheya_sp.AAC.1